MENGSHLHILTLYIHIHCLCKPSFATFVFFSSHQEASSMVTSKTEWFWWNRYTKELTDLMNNFSSVQSLSHIQLFATPWTAALQASLSITNSQSLLKLMSIESMMSSNHLILCHPLLLPPSIFPSIRVFPGESVLLNSLKLLNNF